MYLPPLSPEEECISTWEYRKSLLQDRIGLVDADIVCFQEVSPLTFEEDFGFMSEILGYDGVELFRKVKESL
jgi:mRNA deadenylase 3'-5' endonuclease subunit Ccr4